MNSILTIYELYETDGGGMGQYYGNLGYYQTEEEAKQAGKSLGHPYWKIAPRLGLEWEGGEVYLLVQTKPISFGRSKP